MWERLTPNGEVVIRLAHAEARGFGHPCLPCVADEHLLLGLLRHGTSQAAALLQARGVDLATARVDLQRAGPTLVRGWTSPVHWFPPGIGPDFIARLRTPESSVVVA